MIATIMNFCSNEYPFLGDCIAQAKAFSKEIIIPVCDHFFDGTPQDKNALRAIYSEFPDCSFIEYEFNPEKIQLGLKNAQFWHNLSRLIGFYFVDKDVDYILFIDCDEIVDSAAFMKWLRGFSYSEYEAMQIACYWYFRKESLRGDQWEDTPLLIKKSSISPDAVMAPEERGALYFHARGKKLRYVTGLDQKPMVHHYSWVRTKEQMLHKVASWSHREEKNWNALVENAFSEAFDTGDFVHGYELIEVSPFINVDLHKKPFIPNGIQELKNVRFLNTDAIHKIDLSLRFNIPVQLCI